MPAQAEIISLPEQKAPILLSWREEGRKIIIVPDDDYRFTQTVDEAIRACQSIKTTADFQIQFKKTLNLLAVWIKKNTKHIAKAYLTIRDAGLLFVIIQKGIKYNGKFEDTLTALDLKIANQKTLSDIKLNVMALPNTTRDVYETFLSPEYTLKYKHAR